MNKPSDTAASLRGSPNAHGEGECASVETQITPFATFPLVELEEIIERVRHEALEMERISERSGSAFLNQDCRDLVSELDKLLENVQRRLREAEKSANGGDMP